MDTQAFAAPLAAVVSCLVIGGVIWKVVSWHNDIVAKIDSIAAESKHQHELQSEQIRSLQAETTEFKAEVKRNFAKVFARIDDIAERVARLEGRS